MMRHLSRALTLAVLIASARVTHGQETRAVRVSADSALEARTTEVASTLRCPVCQGESIQDSPAELARQMRDLVRDKLRAGESPESIRAYFVSRYGEWILLEPAMKGLNVVLYALPIILVIGGLALVFVLVRRWTATPATPPSDSSTLVP
jgi:cytochrome c-type biogenesis protein CcmH